MSDQVQPKQEERKRHVIAWELYRDMGAKRSYRSVAKQLGHSVTSVSRWAHDFGWEVRLQAHMQQLDKLQDEGILSKTGDPFVNAVNRLREQLESLLDKAFPRDPTTNKIVPAIEIKDIESLAKVVKEYREVMVVYQKLYHDYKPTLPAGHTNINTQVNVNMDDIPQNERIEIMEAMLNGHDSRRNKLDAGNIEDADYTALPEQGDGDGSGCD